MIIDLLIAAYIFSFIFLAKKYDEENLEFKWKYIIIIALPIVNTVALIKRIINKKT